MSLHTAKSWKHLHDLEMGHLQEDKISCLTTKPLQQSSPSPGPLTIFWCGPVPVMLVILLVEEGVLMTTHSLGHHWNNTYFYSVEQIWRVSDDNSRKVLHENICCGYSLESPWRGNSNEYPQHMFAKAILMNTHNICFHGEINKIIL